MKLDDLSPCTVFASSEHVLAVGWLDASSSFERGHVSPAFFQRLKSLCQQPWAPVAAGGAHACELCQCDAPRFSDNLFVPFAGKVYVAPVAIVHYIAAHWYLPPAVFIAAVEACPPMQSMAYKKALLANGGRALMPSGG